MRGFIAMFVRHRAALVAAAAALGSALAFINPVHAASSPAEAGAHRAAAAAAGGHTYLQFTKRSSPQNSRLSLVLVPASSPGHPRTLGSWRAGSGNGSKDTCASNAGWLPNGTYKIQRFDNHHDGGLRGINGISWYVGDHECHSGHPRTELFIHSEMLPSGRAGSSEPYRWDGNSDYKSNGCIKLKPSDIRKLRSLYTSGSPKPTKLYVR
ncbi:hypothetical protein ABZ370_43740 [Streptomyces sp. NPDC005962]|uniref:hypothetical protein n=1 Tax=Streptomyces sp. NPDC005962 TaxID=3154466 RepID=UPI0033E3FF67